MKFCNIMVMIIACSYMQASAMETYVVVGGGSVTTHEVASGAQVGSVQSIGSYGEALVSHVVEVGAFTSGVLTLFLCKEAWSNKSRRGRRDILKCAALMGVCSTSLIGASLLMNGNTNN